MAKKKTTEPAEKVTRKARGAQPAAEEKLDEETAIAEQGQIDAAFSDSARDPGEPQEASDGEPAQDETAVRLPTVRTFAAPVAEDEYLPAFQKVVFIEFSEHEYAEKAKAMAQLDAEEDQAEVDKADVVKEWNDKIKGLQARRKILSNQVQQKGEEKEIECRKRILEDRGILQIFNAENLEIVEERKLGASEMQTEMRLAATVRAAASTNGRHPRGKNVVEGKFPAGKKFGETVLPDASVEEKNEAVVKALAAEKF